MQTFSVDPVAGRALHPEDGLLGDAGEEEPAHLPHQQLRSRAQRDNGERNIFVNVWHVTSEALDILGTRPRRVQGVRQLQGSPGDS